MNSSQSTYRKPLVGSVCQFERLQRWSHAGSSLVARSVVEESSPLQLWKRSFGNFRDLCIATQASGDSAR